MAMAGMNMDDGDVSAFQAPIDYIPSALGTHAWKMSTDSEQAQNYFNQGIQLRWAFNINESARSMAEARRIDPDCAICYWGEAFGLGSFLNGGMSAEKAPYAHEAIERAVELSNNASEMERDLIMAARVRYPADYDPDNRRPVDEAFAAEMAEVYEKYPDDHNVAAIYAVSLFLLEERRGYRDINDPDLIRLHGVLTKILDEDIKHPGACHLYIHATESSQRPDLALACADFLSETVPVASHIQHMPSHTWNEVGYWGKSVKANTYANHSDERAKENEGFSYAPSHNLHMLLFAASYDGQGAAATQAGKDYAKLDNNSMYHVLTLLRFGRFDEIPGIEYRPESDIPGGMWDFAQGYAALRNGDTAAADEYLAKVTATASSSEDLFRRHSAELLLGIVGNILQGEMYREAGDLDAAIAAFEIAVSLEDQMDYDEPEALPFAARHWLGDALLESGLYADAEQVYRDELADHPHNGWSLYGLRVALDQQAKVDDAVELDWTESWSRSDVYIDSSRF
jgi:tetratricopeptide (TPR) repeat protein